MEESPEYKPKILVYGIDRVGLQLPKSDFKAKHCVLHFEPFDTEETFQDYDGVILFQGIFEVLKEGQDWTGKNYIKIYCSDGELQRRKKQYSLLLGKKGFICFLLIEPFVDRDVTGDTSDTDLAKYTLKYSSFSRKYLGGQETHLKTTRNEFIEFLKHYGAACTVFDWYDKGLEIKHICEVYGKPAGIVLWNKEYFIPTLKPKPHETEAFFKLLGDSLISSHKKLSEEIPDWANEYRFEEEKAQIEKKGNITK